MDRMQQAHNNRLGAYAVIELVVVFRDEVTRTKVVRGSMQLAA
jgi:hypothetical protein